MDQIGANARTGRRVWIGISLSALGAVAMFLLMANQHQLRRGSLYGLFALFLTIVGLFRALGLCSRSDRDITPLSATAWGRLQGEPGWAAPKVTLSFALLMLVVFGFALGPSHLSWVTAAALFVVGISALRRPGLLVFVVASALYLPLLGGYGLWDPWETHYGEVTREILSRDDWISLWWAQDRWFWSKPILIFWSEAVTWHALSVPYRPDQFPVHVEWALRLPNYLMAMCALMAIYASVARFFGRRAGVVSALVLATMPHFFFMAHQAITDMPFVANMTVAVALLLLATGEDSTRQVRTYSIGPFLVSAQHAVLGALLALALPQVIYLATRNVTLVDGPLFAWHLDEFVAGSGGNQDVPGNAPFAVHHPYAKALWLQPMFQAALWLSGIVALVWMLRRERRAQSLYMFGFYICCALAFMAKGIPGVALPGLVALLRLSVGRHWSLLLEGRLRIAAGALTVSVVGFPWFVAMYIRHGPGFTNRLLIHDHINRLASGVHGDTGSIQYFLAQLGYGTFPWGALAPAALATWLYCRQARGTDPSLERQQREVVAVIGLWFVAVFTLFSAMITKFHHYIFPALPPLAVLFGLCFDSMLGSEPNENPKSVRSRVAGTLPILLAPTFWVVGIAGLYGDVRGILPAGLRASEREDWVLDHPWHPAVCLGLLLLGAALVVPSVRALRRMAASQGGERGPAHRELSLSAALAGGVAICAFVARDLCWVTSSKPAGYERLIHLFVYNYGRPWPEQFDYRPMLSAFALVATACCAVAVARALRPLAARALLGTALAFSVWCLDIYMIDLSPHWGQRELMEAYYRERNSPAEPLVAWQMNWKGENIYTGNRVAVFADLKNDKIKEWMAERKGKRAFFVLEHSRLGRFRGLLKDKKVRELTDKRLNNKFVLVSAVL